MLFEKMVDFSGAYTFAYSSGRTSTVSSNGKWSMSGDMRFEVGRKLAENFVEPLYFVDDTATLKFSGCSLVVTESGMKITRGTVSVSHDVEVEINSTMTSNGFILGDGTESGDMKLNLSPGSAMHVLKGHVVMDEYDPQFLSLKQGNAQLIRDDDCTVYVNQDLDLENFVIYTENGSSTIVAEGKSLTYRNCLLKTVFADFRLSGVRGSDYCNLLMSNDEINLLNGTLPAYTYVYGSDNVIRGNGNISGLIALQNSAAELQFNLNGSLLTDVALGGGTVELAKDLEFVGQKKLTGEGKVNLSSYDLSLGNLDTSWTNTIFWDGNDGHISINSMISFSGTWTFSGVCVVHGNWNTLVLGPTAEIVVDRGSTLILRELKIKDLSANKIRCLDNNGMVRFSNSKTKLDGNFTFSMGGIQVVENFEVHGSYTFDYCSTQSLYVTPCTYLMMQEGSTLSYNPASDCRTLIELDTNCAVLQLNSATLHSTSTGLWLKGGMLVVDGDSYISSDASVPYEGIWFGDGVSVANDVMVRIMPSSELDILSGYLVDKSVNG